MTTTIKISDVVEKFSGSPSEDIEQWLDRYRITVELTTSVESTALLEAKLAHMIPLFLEGPAYTTWKQLSSTDKKNIETIKSQLRRVYGKTKWEAWTELKAIKFLPGEPVDVLVDKIKRLLGIMTGGKDIPSELVALTLLDILPDEIQKQVRLRHGEDMKLDEVTSSAKAMLTQHSNLLRASAGSTGGPRNPTTSRRCYGCGRTGHLRHECRITCFNCGQKGHFKRDCQALQQGNGYAGVEVQDPPAPAHQY